ARSATAVPVRWSRRAVLRCRRPSCTPSHCVSAGLSRVMACSDKFALMTKPAPLPQGTTLAAQKTLDRAVENVGNILALEHLNLTVPDQNTAAMFYVSGLGFTRDPYVDFGVFNFNNMWVNVGDQQFHLPQGKAQVFRGVIGLIVPDLDQLRWRLE